MTFYYTHGIALRVRGRRVSTRAGRVRAFRRYRARPGRNTARAASFLACLALLAVGLRSMCLPMGPWANPPATKDTAHSLLQRPDYVTDPMAMVPFLPLVAIAIGGVSVAATLGLMFPGGGGHNTGQGGRGGSVRTPCRGPRKESPRIRSAIGHKICSLGPVATPTLTQGTKPRRSS